MIYSISYLYETKYILGGVFLLLQVGAIIYARFIPERYFCWAPYDEHTYYEISVKVKNQFLSNRDIKARYKYQATGWEPRAIGNVLSLITQYENTYGIKDKAQVSVRYSTNGHKERVWRLPKK